MRYKKISNVVPLAGSGSGVTRALLSHRQSRECSALSSFPPLIEHEQLCYTLMTNQSGRAEKSMDKLDLQNIPLDELWSLHEEITRVLSIRITAQKRELEQRLLTLNQRQGPIPAGNERPARPTNQRRHYPLVFPKYRNPFVPGETWSGRGKRPRWLVAALQAGSKIEDFAISGEGKSEGSLA
jgi:DNA-binding protein H-NS